MTKKRINTRRSSWKWYAVKLLFECIISGEPSPETIDDNYARNDKTYEESIFLIRAQSFEQAYKLGEKRGKEAEHDYLNVYGETVYWQFIGALDSFELFDEDIVSGTELYSRYIHVPKTLTNDEVIANFYPETSPMDPEQSN